MNLKDIVRPPYRFARRTWIRGMGVFSRIQIKTGSKPMRPPNCKVAKAKEIRRILLPMMKYDYGIRERGLSYEYFNVYLTLKEMGYEVELFDFMTIFQEEGKMKMNELLWHTVNSYKPDLVFFALFEEQFDKRTILRISEETPSITLNWFADDDWRFHIFSKYWAPSFNFCTTTHRESLQNYLQLGYDNIVMTQWAANDAIYKNLNTAEKDIDVSFVGAAHGNRKYCLKYLENNGIHVECFGNGWKNGRINQDEVVRVFNRSKINLNFSASSVGLTSQIKGRVFEIPLSGGFMLTEFAPHLDQYLTPGKEVAVFESLPDLANKIRYFLLHDEERRRIANAGYRRSLAEHTYKQRFNKIFSEILNQ